jgi:hypothetical protein
VAGCGKDARNYELDARSFTPEFLKIVEQRVGIRLPDGSRGLNMYYQGAQIDPSLFAKIEIPSTESEKVIEQISNIPAEEWSISNPLVPKKITWWNLSKDSTRVERRYNDNASHGFVDIALCNEGGRWILYVQWAMV